MKKYSSNQILTQAGLQKSLALVVSDDNIFLGYETIDNETIIFDGILTPGWVNSHAHIEFSHLSGKIAPHQGMADFIEQIQSLRDDNFYQEAKKILNQVENEGCVLWVDITNHSNYQNYSQIFDTKISFLTFFECLGLSENRANYFIKGYQMLVEKDSNLLLTFHSPYSCGDYVIEQVVNQSNILSVHLSESLEEVELLQKNTGKLVNLFKKWGIWNEMTGRFPFRKWFWNQARDKKVIWVHNTETENIEIMGNEYFCLCPGANEFLHNRLPDPKKFINIKNRLLLGTDSAAGNRCISLNYEIQMMMNAGFTLEECLMALTWNAAECWDCKEAGFFENEKISLVLYNPETNTSQQLL